MPMQSIQSSVIVSAALAVSFTFAGPAFAAENHVIKVGDDDFSWTYKDKASAAGSPLVVDDLKIGDTIEVQLGDGSHGFVTTKKNDTPPPPIVVDKVRFWPAAKMQAPSRTPYSESWTAGPAAISE